MENSISSWLSFGINTLVALIALITFIYNNKKNSDYVKNHSSLHTKVDIEIQDLKDNKLNNTIEHKDLSSRIKVTEEYNNELFEKLGKLTDQMIESNQNMKVIVNHLKLDIK